MRIKSIIFSSLLLTFLLNGVSAAGQTTRVLVEDHDSLTVYYPRFIRIDFVTNQMPQKTEKDVIFVCAASFTGELLDEFKHSNIAGHHVTSGSFYKGYKCGPYNGVFHLERQEWMAFLQLLSQEFRTAPQDCGRGRWDGILSEPALP